MDSETNPLDGRYAEVRRENEELLLALAQAKREAEESRKAAQAAQEELEQFVYAASHDLQQQLRSIAGSAQLLQRDYAQDKQASELTAFIVDGANQMGHLVRDLLTYSRTGTSLRLRAVKLNVPLQGAVLKLTDRIRETGAKILAPDLPEVNADERQLSLVFESVIDNALKYRDQKTPELEVSAEEGPEFVTVSLKDNGPGIEPRFHDQVFLPFKRLHGKEIPGTGLGLAMCRKIIEAHGGSIWVESDGRNGTIVKFTMPI